MWTTNDRARYDRSFLRYPSDLTDDEWALVEPLIPAAKPAFSATKCKSHYARGGETAFITASSLS